MREPTFAFLSSFDAHPSEQGEIDSRSAVPLPPCKPRFPTQIKTNPPNSIPARQTCPMGRRAWAVGLSRRRINSAPHLLQHRVNTQSRHGMSPIVQYDFRHRPQDEVAGRHSRMGQLAVRVGRYCSVKVYQIEIAGAGGVSHASDAPEYGFDPQQKLHQFSRAQCRADTNSTVQIVRRVATWRPGRAGPERRDGFDHDARLSQGFDHLKKGLARIGQVRAEGDIGASQI